MEQNSKLKTALGARERQLEDLQNDIQLLFLENHDLKCKLEESGNTFQLSGSFITPSNTQTSHHQRNTQLKLKLREFKKKYQTDIKFYHDKLAEKELQLNELRKVHEQSKEVPYLVMEQKAIVSSRTKATINAYRTIKEGKPLSDNNRNCNTRKKHRELTQKKRVDPKHSEQYIPSFVRLQQKQA